MITETCKVCGMNPSVVTVYRHWLRELVRSDECIECFDFMNSHVGKPKIQSIGIIMRKGIPTMAGEVMAIESGAANMYRE